MSTNARIGIDNGDGTATSIYTHFDGYPTHHAPILAEHYAEPDKLRALLTLGDLSILAPELGVKRPFDAHRTGEFDGWCLAYGRDRGETDVDSRTHPIDQWPSYGQAYEYLLRSGGWVARQMTYHETDDGFKQKSDAERPWLPLGELFEQARREAIEYLRGELEHADRAGSAAQEIARLEGIRL